MKHVIAILFALLMLSATADFIREGTAGNIKSAESLVIKYVAELERECNATFSINEAMINLAHEYVHDFQGTAKGFVYFNGQNNNFNYCVVLAVESPTKFRVYVNRRPLQ